MTIIYTNFLGSKTLCSVTDTDGTELNGNSEICVEYLNARLLILKYYYGGLSPLVYYFLDTIDLSHRIKCENMIRLKK